MKKTIVSLLFISFTSQFAIGQEFVAVNETHVAHDLTGIDDEAIAIDPIIRPADPGARSVSIRATNIAGGTLIQWNLGDSQQKVLSASLERSQDGRLYDTIAQLKEEKSGYTDNDDRSGSYYRIVVKFANGQSCSRIVRPL